MTLSMQFNETDKRLEAEKAVLGSVLVKPEVIDEIHLEERDFSVERHRIIWRAMKYLANTDKPIDLVTLTEMMNDYKRLQEVGGVVYLMELAESVPSAANAPYYAKKVQQTAILRRVQEAAMKIHKRAEEAATEEAAAVALEFEQFADEIIPDDTVGMKHISELEDELWYTLENENDKLKTGFELFDDWSGGVERGRLYILAGRPSVGKTAKMLQMATAMAKQNQGDVLIYSQEMSAVSLLLRILTTETKIPYRYLTVEKKALTAKIKKSLSDKFKELTKLPFYIDDAAGATIEKIKSTARQIKRRKGKIGAIFVDYLQIMEIAQPPGMTRAQAIGNVTREAKNIARDLECPFIMVSQLNREKEREVVPTMAHLKESGAIEQDADIIEFLYAHPDDEEKPISFGAKYIRSRIAKNRDVGADVEFLCKFEGWCQKYTEIREIKANEEDENDTGRGKRVRR